MEHAEPGPGQGIVRAHQHAWQLARMLLQLSRNGGLRDDVHALLTNALGAIDRDRHACADAEPGRASAEHLGAGCAEGHRMHGPVPAFPTDDPHPGLNAAMVERDISLRQVAELALSDPELRYSRLSDSASVMLRVAGADHRCTNFSKGWLEFVGRSMVAELGTGWTNGVHPEDRHGCYYTLLAAVNAREDFVMEYRLRRYDGAYRWILDRGAPRYLSDGQFAGYTHACVDTTEQKEVLRVFRGDNRDSEPDLREGFRKRTTADERLQQEVRQYQPVVESVSETERRCELALQGANDGVWDWDIASNSVYFSPRWKSMLGYDDHEIADGFDEWRMRVHPDDLGQALADVEATVHGGRTEYKNIHRMRHKDGTYRWILARGQLLTNEQGEPYRMIGTHVDITECKEREKQLHALPSQLLAAQEAERKRIASELHDGVAQDLNVAKLGIEKCIAALEQTSNDDTQSHLQHAVYRIQGAMDEIRTLSMDLMPSMLDDLGLVMTVKWFCRVYEETYPHIRVVHRVGVEESEIPAALKVALYRIVQEAFTNVAKHANATKVCLELFATMSGLILRISDNGCGLGQNGRFNREGLGTGLGLRSMRERAVSNGGCFAIGPNAEQGTTVCASWSEQQLRLVGD